MKIATSFCHICFVSIIVIFSTACAQIKNNTPEEAAITYFTAVSKEDYATLKLLFNFDEEIERFYMKNNEGKKPPKKEFNEASKIFKPLMKPSIQKTRQDFKKRSGIKSMKVIESKVIKDNKVSVTIQIIFNNEESRSDKLDFYKLNEKWYLGELN